jgi:DNA-binding transcriptional ArsR family regulator
MRQGPREIDVAQAVADPIRLEILHRLMEGPVTVSEIAAALSQSQPKISNHLAVLRKAGLVQFGREGRKSIYRLSGPSVAVLIESISALARGPDESTATPELARARTCYDHLAGALGVGLFDWLLAEGAITKDGGDDGAIGLGPRGHEILEPLGVDLRSAARKRRRFALACLDWTEKKTHLGGSLGASLADALLQRGWVVRRPGSRALAVSANGRRQLRRLGVLSRDAIPG